MIIYIEDFNILSILTLFIKVFFNKKFRNIEKKFFYIYSKNKISLIFIKFFKIFNFEIEEIKFSLMQIRDDNGEIVRLRITQNDLFKFEEKILKSKTYKYLLI